MAKFSARRRDTENFADSLVKKIEPSEMDQLEKFTSAMQEVPHGDLIKLKLCALEDYKKLEQRFVSQDSSKFMESALRANLEPTGYKVQNVNLVRGEPFNLVTVQQSAAPVREE